jgi:carbon monoxide dehydrogenase subunit G
MAKEVVASIHVNARPEAAWALICDPHRYPEIADPTERMIEVPDDEMGVGYAYKEYGGIKPFLGESEWRVTEFDPVRRQVHVGDDGSMTMNLEIELTPVDGGTQLTQTFNMTPRWYIAPVNVILWPLFMRKRAQESMDKTVENFKRVLESSD